MDETVLNAKKYMDIAKTQSVAAAYKALAKDMGAETTCNPIYDAKSKTVNLTIPDIQVKIDGKIKTVSVSVKNRTGAKADALLKAFMALVNPIEHFCVPVYADRGPAKKAHSLYAMNDEQKAARQEEIKVYLCGPTGVCLSVPRKSTAAKYQR